MPDFQWPEAWQEFAVAKKVVCACPSKPVEWDEVAAKLSQAFSNMDWQVELKGKGCRERMDRLL